MHNVERNSELSQYRCALAEETLQNAEMSFLNGYYRDAINRSYYAVFYGIKAVLALEGVDFKRHKDVVAYFNKEYVAKGLFPNELGRKLARLKTKREQSDYDDFYIASKDEAEAQIETVRYILPIIKEHLEQN